MSFQSMNTQLPSHDMGTRLYKGTVIDNRDPLHLDRVKVKVSELYEPDLGEVPWVIPIKQCLFGQGQGFGSFGVPPIGATVVLGLQGDDPNFPYYYGYFLTENGKRELDPGIFALTDQSGSDLVIDCNANTLTYTHVTGIKFHLVEGTLNIECPSDININVSNARITSSGDTTIKCSNANIEASGNVVNKCSTFVVEASVAQLKCPVQCGSITTVFSSGGVGAQIKGGIENTGGTVKSNGIVLESHVHGGVQGGPSTTGGPQ